MNIKYCRIRKTKVKFDSLGVTRIFIQCEFNYQCKTQIHEETFSSSSAIEKDYITAIMRFANVKSAKKLKNAVIKVLVDDYGKTIGFGDPILDELFVVDHEKFEILSEKDLQEKYKYI